MAEVLNFLSIPGAVAVVILGIWAILQVIGEILELKGKIVPEFMKIRKFFARKKKEKADRKQTEQETAQTLLEVKQLLSDVNAHYSADNISRRDCWMHSVDDNIQWTHERAAVYDNSIASLKDDFRENMAITVDLYINFNRNRILDFASKVADDNALASKEEFNRIYKINRDYHEMLAKYGKENGEVDTAMTIINEAYEYRMRHHSFIEDIRGYH